MGHDQEAGAALLGDVLDQGAEPVDIVVVERRIDLVENADRRRIGQEYREQQGDRRERLLAAGEQRQALEPLARRARHDFQAGIERVVRFGQRQMGAAAAVEAGEQGLEMPVDGVEGVEEPRPAFAVQGGDRPAEPLDRADQVVALGLVFLDPFAEFLRFLLGAVVDRAHAVALAQQPLQPPFGVRLGGQGLVRTVFGDVQQGVRAAVQALGATLRDLGDRLFRLADQTLGQPPALARLGERLLGIAQLAVNRGERRLGLRQRRRRRAAGRLALGDQRVGRRLPGREIVRLPLDLRRFGGNTGAPLFQCRRLGLAGLDAPAPAHRVLAGIRPPPGAGRRLGLQPVAVLLLQGEVFAQGGELPAHVRQVRMGRAVFRNGLERALRFGQRAGGFGPFALQRRQRLGDGFQAAALRHRRLVQRDQRRTPRVEQIEGLAHGRIGAAPGLAGGIGVRPGGIQIGARRGNLLFHGSRFPPDRIEAVLLRQAPGRGGRRAGSGDEAVPPHHAAVPRHRALPLGEQGRDRLEQVRILDHGNLVEPAGQRGRRLDEPAERPGGARQVGTFLAGIRTGLPADRRLCAGPGIDRRVEIVAQGGAERGLVAGGYPDILDHRPRIAGGAALEQRGQRIGFGPQAGQRLVMGLVNAARLLDRFGRVVAFGFGPVGRGPGSGDVLLGGIGHALRSLEAGARFVRVQGIALGPGGENTPVEPFERLLLRRNPVRRGSAPGLPGGRPLGRRGHLSLEGFDLGAALLHRRRSGGARRLIPGLVPVELPEFLVEAAHGAGRVGQLRPFPLQVAVGLFQPLAEFLAPRRQAPGFLDQPVALDQMALQFRRCRRFVFAQAGQRRAAFGRPLRQRRRRTGQGLDLPVDLGALAAGIGQRGIGLGPAQMQQDGLGAPDMPADVAIAGRLANLAFEPLHLFGQLGEQVFQPVEVGLRTLEAQFGLVAPGVQARDARGLFQHQAPLGRLGRDHGRDPALAHHGGGARAGLQVGKQQLDVAGARLIAVDPVAGPLVALDPAGDVDLLEAVDGSRRVAGAVGQVDGDLGDIARRAVGRAVEDDVVHTAAAQLPGGTLAHAPAERLEDVGLAAAVGSDDAGQAGRKLQFRRIDEGFETRQTNLVELDQPVLPGRRRRRPATCRPRPALP